MIYIHAGYPKAASTTIQTFLWANAAALAKHGLIYPKVCEPFSATYGTNPHTHNALAAELGRGGPGPAWQAIHALVCEHRHSDILLSGENFFSQPDNLRAALGDEPVKIIFYIRDLAKTIVSVYAHRTKAGLSARDFDTFFDRFRDRFIPRTEHFEKWIAAFGAGNIAVRLVDGRLLAGGDVRTDVLDAAGLSLARIDRHTLEMTPDGNVSPGWKTLEILRDLHQTLARERIGDDQVDGPGRAKHWSRQWWESEIWVPARKLTKMFGFTERGNYLTGEQFVACAERFDAQIGVLQGMGMETHLARTSRDGFVPRTFLPSIEHVPAAEAAEFLHRLLPARYPGASPTGEMQP